MPMKIRKPCSLTVTGLFYFMIPAGTFTLTATTGSGVIRIYDTQKDYDDDLYDYKPILLAAIALDNYQAFIV